MIETWSFRYANKQSYWSDYANNFAIPVIRNYCFLFKPLSYFIISSFSAFQVKLLHHIICFSGHKNLIVVVTPVWPQELIVPVQTSFCH